MFISFTKNNRFINNSIFLISNVFSISHLYDNTNKTATIKIVNIIEVNL